MEKGIGQIAKKNIYLSRALGQLRVSMGARHKRFNLLYRIITSVVMRAHNRVDNLAIVGHLGEDPGLQDLGLTGLHGRQDFSLLTLRHSTESHS